jgi:hypothetical protein
VLTEGRKELSESGEQSNSPARDCMSAASAETVLGAWLVSTNKTFSYDQPLPESKRPMSKTLIGLIASD